VQKPLRQTLPAKYQIKAASTATGINEETLRAWETRYGAVVPERDATNRRKYSKNDLIRLGFLRRLTTLGHAIGQIARLSTDDLEKLLASSPDSLVSGPKADTEAVNHFCEALEQYDVRECRRLIAKELVAVDPFTAVLTLISPVINAVGHRWAGGDFSIAQEHLATVTIRNLLISLTETYQLVQSSNAPCILFGTLSGERHELGALIANYVAASVGYRCVCLGPDLPETEFVEAAKRMNAAVIGISIAYVPDKSRTIGQLADLADQLPTNVGLWLGGRALTDFARGDIPSRYAIFTDLEAYRLSLLAYLGGSRKIV